MGRAGGLALVFFGLLAFVNSIQHPFVHDDVVFILKDPHIRDLTHWYSAFQVPAARGGLNTYYRPLLEIIYRLEFWIWGPNPYGFHFVNHLVHIANGLLVFGLLMALRWPVHVAWITALVFLIHPVQTEAVSCISGISNLAMAFFVLLALHAYVREKLVLALLCFTTAFLGKEQAAMFVPLIIVIDCYRDRKNPAAWVLFGLATLVLLALRQAVTGASLLKAIAVSPYEFYLRLAAIPQDLGMYLRLIVWPADLHYYRSTNILGPQTAHWAGALAFVLVLVLTVQRFKEARATLYFGLGWFLAALLPVLNIAPLINEYALILTPEHFLYLPIVGIVLLLVSAADRFLMHFKKLLLGLVIFVCLVLTWYQNGFWRSEIVLFERMLRYEPEFGRGHLLLAKAYYFRGHPREARFHFSKAYQIMSGYAAKSANAVSGQFYAKIRKEILFDWAENDFLQNQWAQSLTKLKMAASIDGQDPAIYNNMAFAYLHLGQKQNAYQSLKQALRLDPSFTQARDNLVQLSRLR